jgi:signal peptidase II
VVAAIVVGVVVVDQLTKTWAVRELVDGPTELLGSNVAFRLSRNSGGAFSLFQGFTPLLAVLAIVLAVVLVRALQRTRDPLVLIALALILGGAIGNLLDRVARSPGFLRGEVVDFVDVGRFPVFNVADSAITIGAVLLFVAALRSPEADPA